MRVTTNSGANMGFGSPMDRNGEDLVDVSGLVSMGISPTGRGGTAPAACRCPTRVDGGG
jgi:hypothetical protein